MSRWVPMVFLASIAAGCEDGGLPDVNLFTIEDDKQFGKELAKEIENNPDEYPLLDEAEYADAYDILNGWRDEILASDDVEYAEEFDWPLKIIHDDETLNAFAAPGGHIYVYTGLIRFLSHEDHLAGVLGHEIAHADQRHSTDQLTKAYGVSTLLSVLFGGDPGLMADIASALVSLEFSREDEAEADEFSVYYLCDTDWAANGAAGFFELLLEEQSLEIPEFLSTHPSSENRVQDINALAAELGCPMELDPNGDYAALLDALPPPR